MNEAHLLSLRDFCREFELSRSFTYRLLRDGTLTGVKVGRLTRIRREDAEAWAAKLTTILPPKRKPRQRSANRAEAMPLCNPLPKEMQNDTTSERF